MMRSIIESVENEYRRYEKLGEGAIAQLRDEELADSGAEKGNSAATMVWHISGNLKSRFTDFLTSDGEKPWRDRESEFLPRLVARDELMRKWSEGWSVLFASLGSLTDADLTKTVVIRGQTLSVVEALHRSLAHAAYHVGQIVYLAKSLRGREWESLSIAPGMSSQYNENPTMEKGPGKIDPTE